MKRSKQHFVRYCPGSAPGTPAGMTNLDAERQCDRDAGYIEKMIQTGSLPDAIYPHIGICPDGCPHNPTRRA